MAVNIRASLQLNWHYSLIEGAFRDWVPIRASLASIDSEAHSPLSRNRNRNRGVRARVVSTKEVRSGVCITVAYTFHSLPTQSGTFTALHPTAHLGAHSPYSCLTRSLPLCERVLINSLSLSLFLSLQFTYFENLSSNINGEGFTFGSI